LDPYGELVTVPAAALAPAAAAGQSEALMEAAAAGAVDEAGQGQASYGPIAGRQQMQGLGSRT